MAKGGSGMGPWATVSAACPRPTRKSSRKRRCRARAKALGFAVRWMAQGGAAVRRRHPGWAMGPTAGRRGNARALEGALVAWVGPWCMVHCVGSGAWVGPLPSADRGLVRVHACLCMRACADG